MSFVDLETVCHKKINRLAKMGKSNSLLAFSRIVKLSRFAQWPACLMCSLMAESDVLIG